MAVTEHDPREQDHAKTEHILALIDEMVPPDDPEVIVIMEKRHKEKVSKPA